MEGTMTRNEACSKARNVADAIKRNVDDLNAHAISIEEFHVRARCLWVSVEPKGGPICGRRYALLNRVENILNGLDINYGF